MLFTQSRQISVKRNAKGYRSSWTLQAVNRQCCKYGWWAKHLDLGGLFLFWMRQGAKERREAWEEAKAILIGKTKVLEKVSKAAVTSVLRGSALLVFAWHHWSNNILVFGALFTYSYCSILYSFCYLYSDYVLWSKMQVVEKKKVCKILRKCKFMLIFTLVSYIVSTYGDWMILVFICMNYG